MAPLSNDRLLRLRLRAEPWHRSATQYFQSGREAFLALLRSVSPGKPGMALLPSYVPEGLYAPVIAAGWTVKMYPIKADLSPDWDRLASMLAELQPDIAVLIHHFGVPQDAARFASLCREYGVLSVEDLAHLAPLPESPAGTLADIAVTSLPKLFGIPDGAGLALVSTSAKTFSPRYDRRHASFKYVVAQAGALLLSTLAHKLPARPAGFLGKVSGRLFRPYPILMNGFTTVRPMSGLARFFLAHTDQRQETERRIELAGLYSAHLDRTAFGHLVLSPPVSHGMFGYAVLVEDRAGLVDHLAKQEISGTILSNRWDFRGEAGYTLEDGTQRILGQHFIFPLAGRLSNADVLRIIETANTWASLSNT